MASSRAKRLIVIPLVVVLGALLAWAGSAGGQQLGAVPLFALAVTIAYLVQWLAFIPAWLKKTERHFDLTGSLTCLSVTVLVLLLLSGRGPRTYLLAAMVMAWAARLGTFLFTRVSKAGSDGRFDEIKPDFLRFFEVWTIQGLWVSLTAAAAWIAITGNGPQNVDAWAVTGTLIWLIGFAIEVIADVQKSRFNKAHKGQFIQSGLWSWSRHPNYFGEIMLWVGVAVAALPALSGWQYVGLLSPVFVALLLTRGSGIPLLEKRAQATWGDDPEYQSYVRRTSVLVPLPPKRTI